MAKFKIGDKVTDGNGVYQITGIDNDYESYDWKLVGGRGDTSHSKGGMIDWAERNMRLANSVVRNAVVANALNGCARNADGVPPDLWEKLKRTSLAYVVAGGLKNGKSVDELIARFRKSGPGSQIPGRAQDSAIAASVLEEMKRRGINACGTARNAFLATQKDVTRLCDKGIRDAQKLIKIVNEWKRDVEKYKSNPNLQDQYAQDEYERIEGLCQGFADALRAMGW